MSIGGFRGPNGRARYAVQAIGYPNSTVTHWQDCSFTDDFHVALRTMYTLRIKPEVRHVQIFDRDWDKPA